MNLLSIWTAPQLLLDFSKLDFSYHDEYLDFNACENGFEDEEETNSYFFSWTGNPDFSYEEFRIIGYDGTGSATAIWIIDNSEGKTLLDQPVVHFDSEGMLGELSANFYDFLWHMANWEVYSEIKEQETTIPHLIEFAIKNAPSYEKNPSELSILANQKAGHFEEYVLSQVKY